MVLQDAPSAHLCTQDGTHRGLAPTLRARTGAWALDRGPIAREGDIMDCRDGKGERHNVEAEGEIISPEGQALGFMCKAHAERVIAEYKEKLGEGWTFRPFTPGLDYYKADAS